MMANVIEFTIKGIDKASGPLGSVSGALGKAASAAAAAAAATIGTATAVYAFVASVNDGIDKTAEFAKLVGETTGTMQELQFAAQMGGVGVEQFNAAAIKLNKNVAEAARGMGEADDAIEKLGLNANALSKMPLDDKMASLADGLAGIKDPAEKSRLAMQLFGRDGAVMVGMLGEGSESMKKAAADARFLGLVLSDQAAANAEAFMDSLDRAKGSLKGVSMGIAGELTPVLTGLTNRFANFVAEARPAIIAFAKDAMRNFFILGNVLSQVWAAVKNFVNTIFTAKGFDSFIDGAKSAMAWVIDLVMKAGPIIAGSMIGVFKMIWEAFAELGKWGFEKFMDFMTGGDVAGTIGEALFERIPQATEETRKVIAAMWSDVGDIAIESGKVAIEATKNAFGINIDLATKAADAQIAALSEYGEVAKQTEEAVTQLTFEEWVKRKEAQDAAMSEMLEMHIKYSTDLTDIWMMTFENMAINMATIGEEISSMIQTQFENVTGGFADAAANAIMTGESMGAAMQKLMQNVAKEVIATLIKIGVQRLITSTIIQGASEKEGMKSIMSGAASAFSNTYSSIAAIPIIGPFLAPVLALAAGYAVVKGGQALLGQAHDGMTDIPAEGTYLLNKGERVLAPEQNRDLKNFMDNGGGGGGVNVETLNIHILENATNADSLLRMTPEDMREVVASKIIPALDSLARAGTKPQYLD